LQVPVSLGWGGGLQQRARAGCWLLAAGCWLLAAGYWLLCVMPRRKHTTSGGVSLPPTAVCSL